MKPTTKQPDWENLHYLLTYEIKTSHFKKAPYREYILLDKKLEKKITAAFESVWDVSQEKKVDLRTAAFIVAVKRIIEK